MINETWNEEMNITRDRYRFIHFFFVQEKIIISSWNTGLILVVKWKSRSVLRNFANENENLGVHILESKIHPMDLSFFRGLIESGLRTQYVKIPEVKSWELKVLRWPTSAISFVGKWANNFLFNCRSVTPKSIILLENY